MRVLVAILLTSLPGFAAAQSRSASDPPPQLPAIGLPLPTIGLPLPSPASGNEARVDRGDRRPPVRRDPRDGDRGGDRRRGHRPSVVYLVPAYGFGYPVGGPPGTYPSGAPAGTSSATTADEASPPLQRPGRPTGTLWLDLQSGGGAQVYVDRVYVGTTEEVNGELILEAGTHKIEVRAPGYEPIDVDVKIEAERIITYRGALQPEKPAPQAEPPPATDVAKPEKPIARKPFYAIPGCYLGDVPPKDANLPATCDPSKAVTIWP